MAGATPAGGSMGMSLVRTGRKGGRRNAEEKLRNAFTKAGPCKITHADGSITVERPKKGAITKF